jgi:hypothetical protein
MSSLLLTEVPLWYICYRFVKTQYLRVEPGLYKTVGKNPEKNYSCLTYIFGFYQLVLVHVKICHMQIINVRNLDLS